MAKTLSPTTNPTANPFDLLAVEDEPERPTKGSQQKKTGAPGNQTAPAGPETPAEKAQRRKQQAKEARVKTHQEKEAEALKRKEDNEKALAAMMDPLDGFQVQKGSQKQKPAEQEKKQKTFTKDQFEKLEEKPSLEPKKFQNKQGKTPLAPREPRTDGPLKKEQHTGSETRTQKYTPTERPNKPARHDGYDKQSGSKFAGKSKKDTADWGNPAQDWNSNQISEATPLSSAGWGGDDAQAQSEAPAANAGWGGDDASKADHTEKDKDAAPAPTKPTKPAWDDEGYGKMTFDEFQKTVAAEREKKLKELAGVKEARTAAETQADPSKFHVKEKQFGDAKVVQKQPPKEQPKKKQPEQPKKKPAPAKPQPQAVSVSDVFDIRTRGGAGRGRGGPAASRAEGATDRTTPTSTPPGEKSWQGNSTPKDSPKGPRRDGGGGGGHKKLYANQFPDLPVKNVQQTEQTQTGGAAPAQGGQTQTAAPAAAK